MSEIQCPNCDAAHDGSMDANGWATCKSCVHLWNLKGVLTQGKTQKSARPQDPLPKKEESITQGLPESGRTARVSHERSGYFPDETVPKHTAALTKKEDDSSLPEIGVRIPQPFAAKDKKEPEFGLPANSTMIKVEEESRQNKILEEREENAGQVVDDEKDVESAIANTDKNRHSDTKEGLRAKTDFPHMETQIKEVSETAAHCPVCGGVVQVDATVVEMACPHCDTTFNVRSGEYSNSSSSDDISSSYSSQSYTGTVIGGCKIGVKLGEGGMGSVYMAKQLSLDRDVAIKLLPPELTAQANFMKRFQQEARSLARINHNNIIGIYEFGEDKDTGLNYMMMEYVDGEDLAEVLRKRHHLTEIEALDIVSQSALGLEQAALKGIIHRDIKPDNLMMTANGACKVSDFGLAKNVASNATMTNASIRVGTPAFMSPEQCDGLSLDFRSDIYSLGVTLFVMLTGHLPFNGESPFAIMLKHKSEPAPSVCDSMAHVKPIVDQLVQTMMAKEPEQRFSSWRRLREELDIVIESISGKTETFSSADSQQPIFVPHSDLPTERTDLNQELNENADPADDISSMLSGLGQLDRMEADHPPLRSKSAEHQLADVSGQKEGTLTEEDAFADSEDPLADMLADITAEDSVSEDFAQKTAEALRPTSAAPDLSIQEPGPVSPSASAPLPAIGEAAPMPVPSASGPQIAMGHVSGPQKAVASASGSQAVPASGSQRASSVSGQQQTAAAGQESSASRRRANSVSERSSTSTSASTSSSTSARMRSGTASSIRRGKNADKVRERMAHAQTDQLSRITEMSNRGDVLNGAGKFKKAIKVWEKAAQASTDVKIRENCYNKIRIARLFIAQRRKRRALLSALVVIPVLIAAVYVSTPVVHDLYLHTEIQKIKTLDLHESQQQARWESIGAYRKPFAWYEKIFFGHSYELPSSNEIIEKLQLYKVLDDDSDVPVDPQVQGTSGALLDIETDSDALGKMSLDTSVSWFDLATAAQKLTDALSAPVAQEQAENSTDPLKKKHRQDHRQEIVEKVDRIAARAASHIANIERDLAAINEKIQQGKFEEAGRIARNLKQREQRGGAHLANLPQNITLKIIDESGNVISDADVSLQTKRIRGAYRAYSTAQKSVHIEIRHKNYQTYVGDIPAAADSFTAQLRASAQWSNDCRNANGSWTTLFAGDADYFLVHSAEELVAYSTADGRVLASLKRSDVNKAHGLGRDQWEDSAQLVHDDLYVGSGDGLLLELRLNRGQKQFDVNKVIYEGSHAVLSSLEYDMVFRSGRTRAIVVRHDNRAEIHGRISGTLGWKYSGLSAQQKPQLFYNNEHLYALDDSRFYVFDESGQKKEHIPLVATRTGAACWLQQEALVYPYEEGIALIHFKGENYRMAPSTAFPSAVPTSPIGDLCSDGERIFVAASDGTVRAFTLNEGRLFEQWSQKMDKALPCAFALTYAQGIVCAVDTQGGIYSYNARSGKRLGKINHAYPLAAAPMIGFNRIIFLDAAKKIVSYKIPSNR